MNLTYKFDARVQKIWAISDLHWGHEFFADDVKGERITPIWRERGYESCQEMDYDIIKKINQYVAPEDILVNLGDTSLRRTPEQVENLFNRLNCQTILTLSGNHESSTSRIYREEFKKLNLPVEIQYAYPLKYKNIVFCGPEITLYIRWGETKKETSLVHCAHFPKSIFDKMKSPASEMWCGHSHLGFIETHPESTDYGKIMDCGWDYLKRPLEFWEIKRLMDKKKVVKKDKNH